MADYTTTEQRELRAKCLAESVLDPRIPLGYSSTAARPEIGQTVQQYYRAKHSASGPGHGTYWPLHLCAPAPWEKSR